MSGDKLELFIYYCISTVELFASISQDKLLNLLGADVFKKVENCHSLDCEIVKFGLYRFMTLNHMNHFILQCMVLNSYFKLVIGKRAML